MIAAVTPSTSWSLDKLWFNWFDVVVVLVILFGFWRGRKHGMSRELLPVSQWVVSVAAAGFGYAWVGRWLMNSDLVRSIFGRNFTDLTTAFLAGYLIIVLLVLIVFTALRRHYGPKLVGSAAFGTGEYYLGMVSGALRCVCILITALALLNAPIYSAEDILQQKAYNNRWYGGGMKEFSGDFIPGLQELQAGVFKQSLLGPYLKNALEVLLINTIPAVADAKVPQH